MAGCFPGLGAARGTGELVVLQPWVGRGCAPEAAPVPSLGAHNAAPAPAGRAQLHVTAS